MTQTIAGPNTTGLDTTVLGAATADGHIDGHVDGHTDAIHQLLTATWTQTTDEPEPDWLPAVAATLTAEHRHTGTLPTPQAAHHLLAAALDTARDAHLQALAQRATAEQDWYTFHADVRRRAAAAVNNRHICREGTNAALRDFGIDELRVEYRVQLLVPVSVDLHAHNADNAYDLAEDRIRDTLGGDGIYVGIDVDFDDLRRYDAIVVDDENTD
jgi:hypothetical protein